MLRVTCRSHRHEINKRASNSPWYTAASFARAICANAWTTIPIGIISRSDLRPCITALQFPDGAHCGPHARTQDHLCPSKSSHATNGSLRWQVGMVVVSVNANTSGHTPPARRMISANAAARSAIQLPHVLKCRRCPHPRMSSSHIARKSFWHFVSDHPKWRALRGARCVTPAHRTTHRARSSTRVGPNAGPP